MGKVIVGIGGSHNAGITAYIEDEDKSYVGVGAVTSKEVAERMGVVNV